MLTANDAPLMRSIVALIFLLFLLPAIAYGVAAGTVKSHRDVVTGMTRSMESMSYYLVLVFFMALFIAAFNRSNIGVLIALEGGEGLRSLGLPVAVTLLGVVLITVLSDLFLGSAAQWRCWRRSWADLCGGISPTPRRPPSNRAAAPTSSRRDA